MPCVLFLSRRFLSFLSNFSLLALHGGSYTALPAPSGPSLHAWAAFEQCDILAELDLLQLGESLRAAALEQGGYDSESFDVMVTIADVFVAEHGWSVAQSDGWLERMGLWQDD